MNYYIPQWEERTSYGFRRIDPYAKLFEDRIIFLGTPISDDCLVIFPDAGELMIVNLDHVVCTNGGNSGGPPTIRCMSICPSIS